MAHTSFTIDQTAGLSGLKQGDSIHVIGICGVAMAQIGVVLHELGYRVSGSDKEFYEPMSGLLRRFPIPLSQGFDPANIPQDAALVVIGNAVSYGNPEVLEVERRKLPYTIFPKLLAETVIRNNHSIVVSGTHGKTTTSAIAATVLRSAGKDPGYFIGGVAKGLPGSLNVGHGSYSVVEGDEYDSAFFAKIPKFSFYKPTTLIITSIEFDHADIYQDLDAIISVFDQLVRSVPKSGTVICCGDCPTVARLAARWKSGVEAAVITYGEGADTDVRITKRGWSDRFQEITISEGGRDITLSAPVLGLHNARNVVAVYLATRRAGLTHEEASAGLKTFEGVRRRQDIRAERGGITLIEDFAHHPTAVLETLRAIKERFPDNRLIAVFEPRSNTSRRKVFQEAYVRAFESADEVILCEVAARHNDAGLDLMNVTELGRDIEKAGVPSAVYPDADGIYRAIAESMQSGDVIVVMSNGSFGGLIEMLSQHIMRI